MKTKIAVALVILLLISPVFAPNDAKANVIAQDGEIMGLRSTNSKTFALSDGSFRTDIYGSDLFYEDGTKLVEIDNTIIPSKNSEFKYSNASNSYKVCFNDINSAGRSIKIIKGDTSICFSPAITSVSIKAMRSSDYVKKDNVDLCEFERDLRQDNRSVWYPNVYKNVDYVYSALADGVKEDIILRDKDVPKEYVFELSLDGLNPNLKDDFINFTDSETGSDVFIMLPLYMEDASGRASPTLKYSLTESDGHYVLKLFADTAFLNDENTIFPVRIDPTFVTQGTNYTSDTYISSANSTTNYGTNSYLRTGKDTPYGIRRSYIRFKLPSGYAAEDITEAKLTLTLSSKGSGALNTTAYTSDGFWTSTELVYDANTNSSRINDASIYQTGPVAATVSSNTYTFNVTDMLLWWYFQEASNYGFVIKDTVETNTNIWATFYSSDYSNQSYVPKLSITYGSITPTDHYFSGSWSGNAPYAFDGYTSETDSFVSNAFDNWNGITSDVDLGPLYTTGYNRDIRIFYDPTLSADVFAQARLYDTNGTLDDDQNGTWSYAIIAMNSRTDSIFTPLHSSLKEEIITHELGHALGLSHYESLNVFEPWREQPTVCQMQQYQRYCYTQPTSHDKQNLLNKY